MPRKGRQSRVSREGLVPYKDRRGIPRTLDTGMTDKGSLTRRNFFGTTGWQYKASEKDVVNEGNCVS